MPSSRASGGGSGGSSAASSAASASSATSDKPRSLSDAEPAPSPRTLRKRGGGNDDNGAAIDEANDTADFIAFKQELKNARRNTTLFRAPIQTLTLFVQILFGWLWSGLSFLLSHRVLASSLATVAITTLALVLVAGPNSEYVLAGRHGAWFVVWWVTLGVLSSVGLGTGLHTFVLYLGPYIAMVTLAVTECDTMNVPLEGPDALVCPPVGSPRVPVTFLRILLKVLPACFLWGAGTAIGELPPYFVSRQARLSGQKLEELDELEEEDRGEKVPTRMDQVKLVLYHALQRWGFWAIVICASVPNPLFDLAGITCGHFLIPFWTFFGATFIGKAIVKVQIQSCFVILAFDKNRLAWIIEKIEGVLPVIQGKLAPIFEKQRQQFHGEKTGAVEEKGGSWLGFVWNWLLIVMLLFFVKSIIESSVQELLATRDAARVEEYAVTHERIGVTTRLQEQREKEKKAALLGKQEKK